MRSARERENEAQLAVDYAIHTSRETGCPAFVHGDPFTHSVLADAVRGGGGARPGVIGGYRATTYTCPTSGWTITTLEVSR